MENLQTFQNVWKRSKPRHLKSNSFETKSCYKHQRRDRAEEFFAGKIQKHKVGIPFDRNISTKQKKLGQGGSYQDNQTRRKSYGRQRQQRRLEQRDAAGDAAPAASLQRALGLLPPKGPGFCKVSKSRIFPRSFYYSKVLGPGFSFRTFFYN